MSTALTWTPEPATEMVTHTLSARQLWRQVGWIGQSGKVYALGDEQGVGSEPASFAPLWVLLDNEPPVFEDEENA